MRRLIAAGAVLSIVLAGCSPDLPRTFEDSDPEDRGPTVVVSLPLLADVVDQVMDGFGVVTVLAPDGVLPTLGPEEEQAIAASDLVLVHGLADEAAIIEAATSRDGEQAIRVERVNDWVDPPPVNPATWFDPIAMAGIALGLGDVLPEVDDDNVRTLADWRAAAAAVATDIAASFEQAEEALGAIPMRCRRAVGDPLLLEQLTSRFGVRAAEEGDAGAVDLRAIDLQPAEGQRWQDWFLAAIQQLARTDPDCVAPSPGPSAEPSPSASPG